MFKKKEEITHDTHIELAQKGYETAISLFENAKRKVDEANQVLEVTESTIDEQVKELIDKKNSIIDQRKRNQKFAEKIGVFLS